MAGFCPKCGAPLSSSTGFCSACGTPIAANVATQPVAPPVAPPAVPPPNMAGVPPQPGAYPVYPQKSSNSALKIILIVIAVIVVLGVGAAGIAGYIAYRAIHAAGSSLSIGKNAAVDESDLGVAIYPGATHIDAGGMKMKVGNNLVVSSAYTTSDPANSVVAFYRDKLGSNVQENANSASGTSLVSSTVDGGTKESIVVTVTPDSSGGTTKIMIVHTKTSST